MFCPNCGTPLSAAGAQYPPLDQPFVQIVGGKPVDLNKLVRMYGTGIRRSGAYGYLVSEHGLSWGQAKELLAPLYDAHAGEKISFGQSLAAEVSLRGDQDRRQKQAQKDHVQRMEAQGAVYCPKCLSPSVTARKRGFSLGKGLAGSMISPTAGLIAGVTGSNKLECVCLNCGHTWKPKR